MRRYPSAHFGLSWLITDALILACILVRAYDDCASLLNQSPI